MRQSFAHSLAGRPKSEWESLTEHEDHTARLARQFLARIAPALAPWGKLLGRWHDLGKYLDEFQEKLGGEAVFVDHVSVRAADYRVLWASRFGGGTPYPVDEATRQPLVLTRSCEPIRSLASWRCQ